MEATTVISVYGFVFRVTNPQTIKNQMESGKSTEAGIM